MELLLGDDVVEMGRGIGAFRILVLRNLNAKGRAREEQREKRDDDDQDRLRGQKFRPLGQSNTVKRGRNRRDA